MDVIQAVQLSACACFALLFCVNIGARTHPCTFHTCNVDRGVGPVRAHPSVRPPSLGSLHPHPRTSGANDAEISSVCHGQDEVGPDFLHPCPFRSHLRLLVPRKITPPSPSLAPALVSPSHTFLSLGILVFPPPQLTEHTRSRHPLTLTHSRPPPPRRLT